MKFELPKFDDLASIKTGDMPGDKVEIGHNHIKNAELIIDYLEKHRLGSKMVIAVHGGSGVGKSETASVLGHILNHNGFNTYIMSGDNYPRRIPSMNDAERMRVFREYALKGLVRSKSYKKEDRDLIFKWRTNDDDFNREHIKNHDFMKTYINAGTEGLKTYLGTKNEIDFDEINGIIDAFKHAAPSILLKRMGRTEDVLWYDEVDFSHVEVLILEWTHGNNKYLEGVDFPVLLNSTPEETLKHRMSRNRDGQVDSPFVQLVLELEQEMIFKQSHEAKLIISKSGQVIPYEDYLKLMEV